MLRFDSIRLAQVAEKQGYRRDSYEKVLRLIDVLDFLAKDPFLSPRLALKGGTAINLLFFAMPRLSFDLDLDYTAMNLRDEMMSERSIISAKLDAYMTNEGYIINANSRTSHSLDSKIYSYKNSGKGQDNIKLDINYSLRHHLFPTSMLAINSLLTESPVLVRTLDIVEIYASKIHALLTRAAVRDLFDVDRMISTNLFRDDQFFMLRKSLLFYHTLGKDSQTPLSTDAFAHIDQRMIRRDLLPTLRKATLFDAGETKNKVKIFLESLLQFNMNEQQYLAAFQQGVYDPKLLFDDENVQRRIENHAMILWQLSQKKKNNEIETKRKV